MLTADSLAPARVEPLLTGRFGRPYLYKDTVETTQSLLAPDMPEGAVAVADEQTGGRGRQGRSWDAPPGTALLATFRSSLSSAGWRRPRQSSAPRGSPRRSSGRTT